MRIKLKFVLCGILLSTLAYSQNQLKVGINHQNNDVEIRSGNTANFVSSDLELHGKDGSTSQESFLRFEGISLPPDAVINNAYIVVYGKANSTSSSIITVRGEIGSSAAYPASTSASTGISIKDRPYTSGSVSWETSGCVAGQEYSSPTLKGLLQEMFDSKLDQANIAFRLTGNEQGNFTVHSFSNASLCPKLVIDYSSLYGTSIVEVAVGNDDARQSATGLMTLTAAYLQLGGRTDGNLQAIRFQEVQIPETAEITEAYIEFFTYATSAPAGIHIYSELENASVYTTSANNISSRTYSTNKIGWYTDAWRTDYSKKQTPDLKNIIDEARLKGWQSGKSLAFKFEGLDSNNGASVRSYEGGAAYRPKLVVKYINNDKGPGIIPPDSEMTASIVSTAKDDGREATSGAVILGDAYLRLGGRSDGNSHAIRFAKVEIPKDAQIKDAYIEFYAYASSQAAKMDVYSEIGNPSIYTTTSKDITSRDYSVTKIDWETPALSDYTPLRTPNLKMIIDENRLRGWETGQSLAFKFEGFSLNNTASVRSYEGGEYYRPRLVVEYLNNGKGPGIDHAETDPAKMTQLYINEVSPQGTQEQNEDWIELYNDHDYPLQIKDGIFISNKSGTKTLHELKNILIPAKGFVVLIADELPESGDYHLNFDLKNSGGTVYLSRKANGQIVDQDEITYGVVPFNESYGRLADAAGDYIQFIRPTPGASNNTGISKLDIAFSHERGVYPENFSLNITAPQDMTIRYTLDGKYPSETVGTVYSSPVAITKTTTVKVYAYNTTGNTGVIAHTYILQDNYHNEVTSGSQWQYKQNITAEEYAVAIAGLPIVSISTNAELSSKWGEASIEYIDKHIYPGHDNLFSNTLSRKFGQESVSQLNSGIKFKFVKDAGVKKPNYPFFDPYPNEKFKTQNKIQCIELKEGQDGPSRNVFGLGFMRFSEKVTMNLMKEMGKYALDTRYVNIFVNGSYRGVKTMRNDYKQQNVEELFGDDSDNYTKVDLQDARFSTGIVEADEGDPNVWSEIRSLASTKNFQGFKEKVDVEDLIKFQIMFMFIDCEHEAVAIMHNQAPEYMKAKFTINDTDGAFFGALGSSTSTVPLSAHAMAGGGGNYKYKWSSSTCRNGAGGLFAQFMGSKSDTNAGNLEFKTLVKDYVLETIGPASGDFAGAEGAPLSVTNVQQKITEAVTELDHVYKLDAAYMAYTSGVYNQWKNVDYPRILAQVPERVSYSLSRWLEYGMAHTLKAVTINADASIVENTPVTFSNPNPDTQVYYTLDGSDPMGSDGNVSPSATLSDAQSALELPAGMYTIVTRAFATNNWGPVTKQDLTVKPSVLDDNLIIAGINYNPLSNGDAEFILLSNIGENALDVSGYNISDAVKYTFPQGTSVAAYETIMLAKNISLINGFDQLRKFQWNSGSLSNGGEPVTICSVLGIAINHVTYSSDLPWPAQANGNGYYLKLKNWTLDNSLPESWEAVQIEEVYRIKALATGEVEMEPLNQKNAILEQVTGTNKIAVYPNPATSILNIDFDGVDIVSAQVHIYSAIGTLVYKQALKSTRTMIDVSMLPGGTYILQIIDGKAEQKNNSFKFIKE